MTALTTTDRPLVRRRPLAELTQRPHAIDAIVTACMAGAVLLASLVVFL